MRNLFILLFCFSISASYGQNSQSFWRATNEALINATPGERSIVPDAYEAVELDVSGLKAALRDAPLEFSEEARLYPFLMEMPLPDGSTITFAITESPLMQAGLAAKYPNIKSYSGYSTSENSVKLRFTLSPYGFSGAMTRLTTGQVYYIDRYAEGQTEYYITYDVKDHETDIPVEHLTCGVEAGAPPVEDDIDVVGTNSANSAASARGAGDVVNLRTYRLAITTTGEWGNDFNTVDEVVARLLEGVSRLNQIFEVDLALRVVLVDDNDQLVFQDPSSDPFPDSQASGQMISLNTNVINSIIGFGAYDFGHVFDNSCDTGGLASLGAVCGQNKGSAITCHYTNNFEYAMVRITAHEIGHSFNAPHTWNLCQIGSTDNMNSATAYEPGSGNTIMSYHGVCNQSQDVPEGPHDYYHANSLERIYNFTDGNGGSCPETVETDNHFPDLDLNYTNGFFIPISTPFELVADATDMDDDMLTYCWEQYNLSGLNTPLGSPMGTEPSFRSYPPDPSPMRVFPRMQNIVLNSTTLGEVLPTYTRNLTFRCSVRDNNPTIGAAVWAEMSFEATETAGPFLVTYPNASIFWEVGDYTEVTWDVANTDNNLVNCQNVNILLSTDGGFNYPITLAENVPNDGSHFIVVPDAVSSTARVRIEAVNNIFFDISNANFEIEPASSPGFSFDAGPYSQQICIPQNAEITIPMLSLLNFDDPVTFNVTGLPTGAIANFTNNPATPSIGTAMTIDMSNVDPITGIFEVIIEGMVEGVDTIYRSVFLDAVSNDFSTLALSSPTYGQLSVGETPTFDWATTANAATYEFQLATNPSFIESSIVDEVVDLLGPPFSSNILLLKSTPYFWRVRPVNPCGPGPYTSTFAFHTEVSSCVEYVSQNVPINISSQGTPTIESIIEVDEGGTISDLNVTQVKGQHDLIKDIEVRLESPEETEVVLFSGICGGSNSAPFNLGIDDNAPLDIICPPNSGISFLPPVPNTLAAFNGENSEGDWILRVTVLSENGSGGSLQDWSLEICSNAAVAAPFLVNNEVLLVPPGAFQYVLIDQLFSDDTDNTPNQLVYTLVEKPSEGDLIYNGGPVAIGETFRQSTINAGNLTYQHTAGSELTDQFVFTVSDGNGGWIPPTVFQIQMDENAVVGTTNLSDVNSLLVFPNPTKDVLNVKLSKPVNAAVDVRLYNIQGQLVATQSTMTGMDLIRFETNQLSAGLYFVELSMGGQSLVEKVAVYK